MSKRSKRNRNAKPFRLDWASLVGVAIAYQQRAVADPNVDPAVRELLERQGHELVKQLESDEAVLKRVLIAFKGSLPPGLFAQIKAARIHAEASSS